MVGWLGGWVVDEERDFMAFEAIEEKRITLHAEAIGDEIWNLAVNWPHFVQHSVGLQLVRAGIRLALTSPKAWAVFIPKMFVNFFITRAARCARLFFGCAAPKTAS